jgi:hypothetical protein
LNKPKNKISYTKNHVTKLYNICNNNNFFNSFGNLPKLTYLNKQIRFYNSIAFKKDLKNPLLLDKKEKNKLNPFFVTGLTDSEGCFIISVRINSKLKTGYSVELAFKLSLLSHDRFLLEKLRDFFGVGTLILRKNDNSILYRVGSLKDLKVLIYHFENFPLISEKWSDFFLFKQVYDLMLKKEHLNQEGINKIVAIKSVLNKGLRDDLREKFPNYYFVRPSVTNKLIIDQN